MTPVSPTFAARLGRFGALLALLGLALAIVGSRAGWADEAPPPPAPVDTDADPVVAPEPAAAPETDAPAVAAAPPAADGPTRANPIPLPTDTFLVPLAVRDGSTLGGLIEPWGLASYTVREQLLSVYDLATLRPGNALVLGFTDGDPLPTSLQYQIDEDRHLTATRDGDVWHGALDEVAYDSREAVVTLTVSSSLWQAGVDAGLRPTDLGTLARIFEYELDFNTEIQPDARMVLVADVLSSPGHKDKLGTIHALRLRNGGKTYEMVRFLRPDGTEAWYHPDGTSAKRPFLRSPLEFSRVTSGFNPGRFHPILKVRRPHNGTDFGAPTGTPVRAVADGVVDFAGSSGGHGNFVKLRHEGGYETSYSHLSAILVRRGTRVRQGQLIGRVGSTGLATGPHLHYQMWKGGRYVDALRQNLPMVEPIEAALLPAFKAEVGKWLPKLPE